MKKFLLLFLTCTALNGQNIKSISGVVYAKETKEPLEFVNIGIIDQPIGTITNDKGEFCLKYISNTNLKINFSFVGYQNFILDIESITQNDTIFLSKLIYELEEVVVNNKKQKLDKKGSSSESTKIVTGWSNGYGNGGERGILIKNKKGRHKIDKVYFHIASNNCDNTIVRIRIREIDDDIPTNEILSESVIQKISIDNGWLNFDLSNYNIVYNKDILVSLEWIKSKKNCNFLISGNYLKGTLYYKEASDSKWNTKKRFSPSIYITSVKIE